MLCSDVKAQLLTPDEVQSAAMSAHLAGCAGCSSLSNAAAALDRSVRASVIVPAPAELREQLAALAEFEMLAPAAVLASSLVIAPPAELQSRLLALAGGPKAAPASERKRQSLGFPTAAGAWLWLRTQAAAFAPRGGVLAVQFAALAVLAYAVIQVVGWLTSGPVVLGDVPYAIELLLWSPAVDYLAQLQGLLQQLSLWLLVAAAGWLLSQGLLWQRPSVEA